MVVKRIEELTKEDIASICDHTFLKRPECFVKEKESAIVNWETAFNNFLAESIKLNPYAICIRPEVAHLAKGYLKNNNSQIKVASVVGFPNPEHYTQNMVLAELQEALDWEIDEIDCVLNNNKKNVWNFPLIKTIRSACEQQKVKTKLILETSDILYNLIPQICQVADKLGFDFVKTSTGYSLEGATVSDLKLMQKYFPRGIKISGGVTKENYQLLLRAASGRNDGYIDLDPMKIRIGESKLLTKL